MADVKDFSSCKEENGLSHFATSGKKNNEKKLDKEIILKLLNENKKRLCEVFCNTNVIRLYFNLLGAFFYLDDYATDSEIILPEMDRLLSFYDYDCIFREDGIYHGEERILCSDAVRKNENVPVLGANIQWEIGQNSFFLYCVIGDCGSVNIRKTIKDFSLLTKDEFADLSDKTREQIEDPSIVSDLKINNITFYQTIQFGCEIMKKVNEEYISEENFHNSYFSTREARLSKEESKIDFLQETSNTFGDDLDNYIESHIREMYYGANPLRKENDKIWTCGYSGEKRLKFKSNEKECDYNLLHDNLLNYYKKYPLSIHPINLVCRGYFLNMSINPIIDLTRDVFKELDDIASDILDVDRWLREWESCKINKGYKGKFKNL